MSRTQKHQTARQGGAKRTQTWSLSPLAMCCWFAARGVEGCRRRALLSCVAPEVSLSSLPWPSISKSAANARAHRAVPCRALPVNCSGNKQLWCVLAMFDHDQIAGACVRPSYLRRSAEHLRQTAGAFQVHSQNSIDRQLRLVLTGRGPKFIAEAAAQRLRRARNLFYDHAFADIVYQELLITGARMKTAPWSHCDIESYRLDSA